MSTGSSLLMTLSVKSSWSCTLKEASRREVRGREHGRVREGDRKERGAVGERREVEKEQEAEAGRLRRSFTESVQILRTSSL